MTPKRRLFIGYGLIATSVIIGSIMAASLAFLWPTMLPGTYVISGESPQQFTPPLYLKTSPGTIDVTIPLHLSGYYPHDYSITPDDCVLSIRVNDQVVPLPDPPCLDDRISQVNLGPYLHPGLNILSIRVDDFGGYGGLSINPSFNDSLVLFHLVVLILALLSAVFGGLLLIGARTNTLLIALVLSAGFLVRLSFSQSPGYSYDVNINQGWAKSATILGIAQSYEQQLDGTMMPNYPPLSMEIFAGVGHIYRLFNEGFDRFSPLLLVLIKLPAMLADLVLALVLYFLIRKYRSEKAGMIALLVCTFHPAIIYNSAIWGQVDSIYTLFVAAALFAGMSKRWTWLGVFGALAVLAKLQSIVLLPLAIVFFVQSGKDAWRILLGGVVTVVAVFLPFIWHGNVSHVVDVYVGSVGYYTSLSYGAYNFWHALYGSRVSIDDTGLFFNLMTYRTFGLVLFSSLSTLIVALRWPTLTTATSKLRASAVLLPFHATMIVAYAFFLFNTEMHERYLFPITALGIPLLFLSSTTAWLYGMASLLFLGNLLGTLPFSSFDRSIFAEFSNLPSTIGALHVAVFIALFVAIVRQTPEKVSLKERLKQAYSAIRSAKLS